MVNASGESRYSNAFEHRQLGRLNSEEVKRAAVKASVETTERREKKRSVGESEVKQQYIPSIIRCGREGKNKQSNTT